MVGGGRQPSGRDLVGSRARGARRASRLTLASNVIASVSSGDATALPGRPERACRQDGLGRLLASRKQRRAGPSAAMRARGSVAWIPTLSASLLPLPPSSSAETRAAFAALARYDVGKGPAASARAVAWIGPVDKGAPTVGHGEEGRPPLARAHHPCLRRSPRRWVVRERPGRRSTHGAALSATDWLAVQGYLAGLQGDDR